MAETIAAVSLVATILQLVDFSTKVVGRLNEFQTSLREVPGSFRQISNTLPLLCDTLEKIREAAEANSFGDRTKAALLRVIDGCRGQVAELDSILAKSLPKPDDSRIQRGVKAISSVGQDGKVGRISKDLHGYISTLTFYCTAVSSTLRPLQDQSLNAIRAWLDPPDPSINYRSALKLREPDTGLWFLDGDRYALWNLKVPAAIWLYGIPGCGKSILSSTIIENVTQRCEDDPGKVVAYFYFDFKDGQKQRPELMLRSLICQLSQQCVNAPRKLESLFSSCKSKIQQPTADDLLDVLQDMIQEYPEAYIILDALDECESRFELMTLLEQIIGWRLENLHLLFTSRKERDIEDSLEPLLQEENTICLQSTLVNEDIRKYVRTQLLEDRNLKKWQKDRDICDEIQTTLMKGAHGMFRWAACQLDALGKCRNRLALRNALKSLPPTLDETYDRILCSIREEDITYATRILRWLAFSLRPLTVDEIAEAVAIDIERDPVFDAKEILEDPLEILDICPSLITITGKPQDESTSSEVGDTSNENQNEVDDEASVSSDFDIIIRHGRVSTVTKPNQKYVQLAHYSVKEYLISDRIQRGRAQSYRLQAANCHDYLAQSCLGYISDLNVTISSAEHVNLDRGLRTYAFEKWHRHALDAGEITETLGRRITDFFLLKSDVYTYWNRTQRRTRGEYADHTCTDWMFSSLQRKSTPLLHYAVSAGWERVVERLLAYGADINLIFHDGGGDERVPTHSGDRFPFPDVMATSMYGAIGTPIYVAAIMANESMVRLLLQAGADVNVPGGKYGSALQAAIVGQRFDSDPRPKLRLVRELLSAGADINAEGGEFGTALSAAAACDEDLVRYLLDAGAEVNSKSELTTTALITAVSAGKDGIVKLLLDSGADVNWTRKPHGATALMAAAHSCRSGNMVQILLNAGADVNPRVDVWGTPLTLAASASSENNVRLVLSAGGEVDTKSDFFDTALIEASCRGSTNIVKVLLAAGADINAQAGKYGTALMAAACAGRINVIKVLLAAGADINAQAGKYGTALMAAAACAGRTNVIKVLLAAGADINAQAGKYGTALMAAAACAGRINVIKVLLAAGADINAQAGKYGTALMAAACTGRINVIKVLLAAGADINAQTGNYGTALMAAVDGHNRRLFQLLLHNGADVNIIGGSYESTALYSAVSRRREAMIQPLMQNGADVNARGKYDTVLMSALNDEYILQLLLIAGADANISVNGCYSTALGIAAGEGYEKSVQLLLDAGADVAAGDEIYGFKFGEWRRWKDSNVIDEEENPRERYGSVLEIAAARGHTNIVKLLLAAGADVNAAGGERFGGALDAAVHTGSKEVIELLLGAGANVNGPGGRDYCCVLEAAEAICGDAIVRLLVNAGAVHPS